MSKQSKTSTLFDSKLTPVITETPDSVSIGDNVSNTSESTSFSIKEKVSGLFNQSYLFLCIYSLYNLFSVFLYKFTCSLFLNICSALIYFFYRYSYCKLSSSLTFFALIFCYLS